MSRTTVAKLPGLFQRKGVWQLRVMIPLDLQPAYSGRAKIVLSLDTSDWREASSKGASKRAEKLAEFEDLRRALNPQPVGTLAPELGATIGARIRALLLRLDDTVRGDAALAAEWLTYVEAAQRTELRIGPAPAAEVVPPAAFWALLAKVSPFHGLTERQRLRLAGIHRNDKEQTGAQMASRDLSAVQPLADQEARKLGLLIDWKAPEARPVLLECLRAYKAAMEDLVHRDEGRDVVTPQAPEKVPEPKVDRLRDVFTRWQAAKPRSEDSVRACDRALKLFEQHTEDTPVQQITRAQGDGFRSWLQTLGTASKTAHDRLTWVKSLLVYACRDLEMIPRQPWEGIDIAYKTENPRKPWTEEQIKAFFSLPLFTRHELPTASEAGKDAAYWIPLLGLYTGARIGELAQLQVKDIEHGSDGAWISINEEGEGSTVKTSAGVRLVPVHSELVRLGFLDYVKRMQDAQEARLWPALRLLKGRPGHVFSGWFSEARKSVEGVEVPDFHSLRHTVRTALMEASIDGDVIDRIIGHETRGQGKTYSHPKAVLRRAVEALRFDDMRASQEQRYQVPDDRHRPGQERHNVDRPLDIDQVHQADGCEPFRHTDRAAQEP